MPYSHRPTYMCGILVSDTLLMTGVVLVAMGFLIMGLALLKKPEKDEKADSRERRKG